MSEPNTALHQEFCNTEGGLYLSYENANGAKAKIEECVDGQIRRIVVTDCGSGFTELPEISINTETGYNAILKPIMKFHKPEEIDVPRGTNVLQVIDCVGKVS